MATDRRSSPVQFTLKDVDGEEHNYICTPHSTTEAASIILCLLSSFTELAAKVAGEAVKRQGMDVELEEVFRDPELLAEMGAAAQAGVARVPPAMLPSLFLHTKRDGQALRDKGNYDAAFAGNHKEWFAAVYHIVAVNRFLPF